LKCISKRLTDEYFLVANAMRRRDCQLVYLCMYMYVLTA